MGRSGGFSLRVHNYPGTSTLLNTAPGIILIHTSNLSFYDFQKDFLECAATSQNLNRDCVKRAVNMVKDKYWSQTWKLQGKGCITEFFRQRARDALLSGGLSIVCVLWTTYPVYVKVPGTDSVS